jgi:uncharacterized protein
MTAKNIRVIFDTNVWVSFLIGKRLFSVIKYIKDSSINIIVTDELLEEIIDVTSREKLQKYFPPQQVDSLINLLKTSAENIKIKPIHFINRDPKDNFLLDLIDISKADYLVTGDNDLLELNPFKTATILTPSNFEKIITNELL